MYKVNFGVMACGETFCKEISVPFVPFPGLNVFLFVYDQYWEFEVESLGWSEKDPTDPKSEDLIGADLAEFDSKENERELLLSIREDPTWKEEK